MLRPIGAMARPLALLAAVLAFRGGTPAFGGEGITATVGVTPGCPYGLAGCWPPAQFGLNRLRDVASVREWCDPGTWTAEVRMKEGALPDPEAWDRDFRDAVGEGLKIRGVEVTVVGTLVEDVGGPALRIEGGKTLRLAALDHKVQWDPGRKAEQQATSEEREAHRRLIARLASKPGQSVKVTGPLKTIASRGGETILTVRTFADVGP